MSAGTIATPRRSSGARAIASSMALLSKPWALACTRTAREIPR
jgi:hypothetical protein